MIRLVWLAIAFVAALDASPVLARDLPKGEYLLVGDIFPAIGEGLMVPVFAHVLTGGDRIRWTFFTYFGPEETGCRIDGRCQYFVQSLSHVVSWAEDGMLQVIATERDRGEGLTIDRPGIDGPHIYGAIASLLDGGVLTLTPEGGQITRKGRRAGARKVDFLPATLEQADMALSLAASFNLSLVQLNYCVIRQVLTFAADPDPTRAMLEVLAAARYAGELRRAERAAGFYLEDPEDPAAAAEFQAARIRRSIFSLAVGWPGKDATDALTGGSPLSDSEVMALIKAGLFKMRPSTNPLIEEYGDEILSDWRQEALASVRISSRYIAAVQRGEDPFRAVCADVTLGG